jgi:hypothetical protein
MCGDVDEEAGEAEGLLYARFLAHARTLLEPHGRSETAAKDALSRCVRDGAEGAADRRYLRLSRQPLVLARLAGLLAGHLALDQDPLRKVIEALMQGYAEAAQADPVHHHDHDHDQGHHH